MLPKTDINHISHDLYTLILSIHTKIFNPTVMLKGHPIPPSNMKVIFHLVKIGPCPVSKVANDLMISKPNMTPIIDNLISEGFVNRYDNPDDRRIIMVEATEKAFDFLKKKEQKMKEVLAEKISVLEEEDLKILKTLLPQLTNVITKMQ
jgi:DNA-binding MarR family transcriptional regulator